MPKRTINQELEAMRLPELQAMFAEVTGESSRSPNKKFLIRKIMEALKAGGSEGDAAPEPASAPKKAAKAPPRKAKKKGKTNANISDDGDKLKLSKLDVPALQAKYLEVVGRETSSTNKRYLIWRVQQAMKGKIPTGPRWGRRADGEAVEMKVVSFRLPAAAVPSLDEAWRRLGIKSRTVFFRVAVHAYLDGAGERDVAALFAADA